VNRSVRVPAVPVAVLLAAILVALAAAPFAFAEEAEEPPNIVLFLVDDLAEHDGSLWTDPTRTPALYHHFVERGLDFTNAIAETPLCCPARTNLMTGLHTHNHGVTINDARLLDPAEHVGRALSSAGYASMMIGKYLNRNDLLTPEEWVAHGAGWTHFDAILGRNGAFEEYTVRTKTEDIVYLETHSTRMVAERAISRMREASETTPIFALLSVYNLHAPNTPMPEFLGDTRCSSMPPWKPANYNEADVSDKPAYIRNLPLLAQVDGWPMQTYCEEMLGIDWLVEQVTAELEAQDRLENTLLVFTSDHGVGWGAHRVGQNKLVPYATPVPLMMSWPAQWGAERRTVDDHVSNIDLAPTFCELGGCALGPYPGGQDGPDGMSIVPLLEGAQSLGRRAVLESAWNEVRTWMGMRTTHAHPLGLWHYVEWTTGERELYDLSPDGDPFEMDNVAYDPAYTGIRSQLAGELVQLRLEGSPVGATFRPDASIALLSGGPFKGDDIYKTSPVRKQTQKRIGVQRRTTYDYFVRIQNDAGSPDTVAVHGASTGSTRMRAAYFMGDIDVTDAVVAGTHAVDLAAGAHVTMTIRVTVGPRARLGHKLVTRVTLNSLHDPTKVDVVRAVARR